MTIYDTRNNSKNPGIEVGDMKTFHYHEWAYNEHNELVQKPFAVENAYCSDGKWRLPDDAKAFEASRKGYYEEEMDRDLEQWGDDVRAGNHEFIDEMPRMDWKTLRVESIESSGPYFVEDYF